MSSKSTQYEGNRMISIILPAYYKEEPYLNRTIENAFKSAQGEIEVVVILNGFNMDVDPRARVIGLPNNEGERVAMNIAATAAQGEYLLRIDAHCSFETPGWDLKMTEVTDGRTITVAVLTALYHSLTADKDLKKRADKEGWQDWTPIPGHWYGPCKLMPNMEAKWLTPNRDRKYPTVIPNMAFTGCGFLLARDFYWALGRADENLPKMGAIGEEFAIKAWLAGGKVQTRTDVVIGHIFGTGGYDTKGVQDALSGLEKKYGSRYQEIKDKFPELGLDIIPLRPSKKVVERRTVIVDRTDTTDTKGAEGQVIMRKVENFRYVWTDDGTESQLTEDEIREKYAPLGMKIGEELWLANTKGELVRIINSKENNENGK